jgi:hypothetical protein
LRLRREYQSDRRDERDENEELALMEHDGIGCEHARSPRRRTAPPPIQTDNDRGLPLGR